MGDWSVAAHLVDKESDLVHSHGVFSKKVLDEGLQLLEGDVTLVVDVVELSRHQHQHIILKQRRTCEDETIRQSSNIILKKIQSTLRAHTHM